MPELTSLDHLVLTVRDMDAAVGFYRDVLGMEPVAFRGADGRARWAVRFGRQKINFHAAGAGFEPTATDPRPGSADLCFLTDVPLDAWQAHLARADVAVEAGPVRRTGAEGPILSLYLRDPDGNLIEIATGL